MGLMEWAFARPRAFPVVARGGDEPWERFRRGSGVDVAAAPHGADLLVVAGDVPKEWGRPLAALFETLPLPRAAVWLRPPWHGGKPPGLPVTTVLDADETQRVDPTGVVDALLDPDSKARRPLLSDRPPAPWRGRGEHGQGGEGMMGGKPYGRPMAMTHDDPDGLALGDLPTHLGPFFPHLPSGLEIVLRLQGDRVRRVERVACRFPRLPLSGHSVPLAGRGAEPALRAFFGEPANAAGVERARIESHLAWAASFLELAGLPALARRFRRCRHSTDLRTLGDLFRRAERTALPWLTRGVGVISREEAEAWRLRGPVARASGVARDGRAADRTYERIGFTPELRTEGDAWARFALRGAECLASARMLTALSGDGTPAAEGPRGLFVDPRQDEPVAPSAALLPVVGTKLAGLEWLEAVLFVASLDLDPREAVLGGEAVWENEEEEDDDGGGHHHHHHQHGGHG
jgi:hypothetical protein